MANDSDEECETVIIKNPNVRKIIILFECESPKSRLKLIIKFQNQAQP